MRMSDRRWISVGAIALVVACSAAEEATQLETIRPAKLITVEAASIQRELTFPAVIQAAQSAELTFQIAGEIRELNVLEGDPVQEGDVIARLDQRDARNRLTQSQAEFDNAEAEFQRAERLSAEDAISRSVLDTRRTQRDVARASLDTARKALSDTVLRAPFSGGVSRVLGRQFQNVQAKEAIAILQSAEVEAVMNAPGTIVARIPQLETVETRVVLDAAPDTPIIGVFKEASGEADQATQTYQVAFSFKPPEGLLILPGMTATVESDFLFSGAGAQDIVAGGIAVPLSAIVAEGDERFVWRVRTDATLEKQPVTLSSDFGETVTVVEGLDGGETIVAAGVSFFHEGMKVRPWTPD
ncbi:MAG: efflux RND transporter periplasmic adaptor subunit [Pseudomonadota bacterium]